MLFRLLAILAVALACDASGDAPPGAEPGAPAGDPPVPEYVGRERCASCHPAELERFTGSHHDLAMQEASPDTVLGDFDETSFRHGDVVTKFRREGERFVVNTEGPDGSLADFDVAYTFGVEPLQQYLVPLPGGRMQALTVAWDARPETEGGQRWFSLHGDEVVPPEDVLHWTGPAQRWNFMCAECHSTNLVRGYDLATDRYETTWSELDVSCEACHGPGSLHVAWAASPDAGDRGLAVGLANPGGWQLAPDAAIARRSGGLADTQELDVCARCHARRAPLSDGAEPGATLLDGYHPALLDEGLYFADGQIEDEVYVWGSFLQSRMYAAGVVCSDCHDPHSLEVGDEPDEPCSRCHRPAVFASPEHHGHPPESEGARCVACHMPARTYMVIDDRRDHSFRTPQPARSEALQAPDACTGCHIERSPSWAQAAIERWGGASAERAHFGAVLAAGRRGEGNAGGPLAALAGDAEQPAIARATALRLIGTLPPPLEIDAILTGARDPDPLVRMAAAEAAQRLPPPTRLAIAELLGDDVRAVRIEAARVLADVPAELWAPGKRALLARVLGEYRDVQAQNADRPESHVNLGILHARLGELDRAEEAYRTALRVGPYFVPAYVNLADLYRSLEREDEARGILRAGLERAPLEPGLHHALGLALVRGNQLDDALAELKRAVDLAPDVLRYAYVYGIALSSRDPAAALDVLGNLHERFPNDPELLAGLATLSRDAGRNAEALAYARKLQTLVPDDEGVRALVESLEAGKG